MDDEQNKDYKAKAKEKAKQLRKKAYQQAKERMKSDPRYQALKEQAKQKRKEAYQKAKLACKEADTAQDKDRSHEFKIYKASEMSDSNFPDNVIPIEWAKLKRP
jgi:hypothetical protein